MYHLVATAGAEAPNKSTINPDDQTLTVLGGKASCRRKFVINVHLLDHQGNTVHEEFSIVASVAYAHDRSPIVQDENLFLAEPPLLTTFNGVEYPSQERPTRLVAGKASFKLAISLLSSKYDNRLFCICFTPLFGCGSPKFSNGFRPMCEPCYSKPIRSISRKRSSSSLAVPAPTMSHHVFPPNSSSFTAAPSKVKSPDSAGNEEVDKFFRLSSATSSSDEVEKTYTHQNGGDAVSDSGSLRYVASHNYKQEANLLLCDDAILHDPFHNIHADYSAQRDAFISVDGSNGERFYMKREPLLHMETTHYEAFPSPCIYSLDLFQHELLLKPFVHMESVPYEARKDTLHIVQDNGLHSESFKAQKDPLSNHQHEANQIREDQLIPHVHHAGGCYMGRVSPKRVISQSECMSPISGILTSDGSMEHGDAVLSKSSPITVPDTTERPVSVSYHGSQLSSPFRPYNPNGAATTKSPGDSQKSSSMSPPLDENCLRKGSSDGLLMTGGQLISDPLGGKKGVDAVLQRFLIEASTKGENSGTSDCNIEDEEQSLLALEITLQDAIRGLEKKKQELRAKRQLLEYDEALIHNVICQSSSWVESFSRRYNF